MITRYRTAQIVSVHFVCDVSDPRMGDNVAINGFIGLPWVIFVLALVSASAKVSSSFLFKDIQW